MNYPKAFKDTPWIQQLQFWRNPDLKMSSRLTLRVLLGSPKILKNQIK